MAGKPTNNAAKQSRTKSHTKPHPVYPGRAESGRMLPTRRKTAAEIESARRAENMRVSLGKPKETPPQKKGANGHPDGKAIAAKIAAQEGVDQRTGGAMLAASRRRRANAATAKG